MPFHLITGIPGHGKTSLMMEMLAEAAAINLQHRKSGKTQLVVNGAELVERPIFAAGIDGLVDGVAENLEDPTRWQDLPDGALIFVDECWKWFGHLEDARGKPPPTHVQGIAEHRHRGMDFVATSQGPRQIYPFMRPLIGPHWHVVRRFGSAFIDVYKWGELAEDPQSQGLRDRAVKQTRTLPTKQRDMWKSAAAHTIKTRVPVKLLVILTACVLALPVLWIGIGMMSPDSIAALGKEEPEKSQLAGSSGSSNPLVLDGPGKGEGSKKKELLTPAQYAEQFRPRIPGVHGSQPIFGDRQAKSEPATYCVISGVSIETRCSCYTEQATPIRDVIETVCREWARYGKYDPQRAPLKTSTASLGRPMVSPAAAAAAEPPPVLGESFDAPFPTIPGSVPMR